MTSHDNIGYDVTVVLIVSQAVFCSMEHCGRTLVTHLNYVRNFTYFHLKCFTFDKILNRHLPLEIVLSPTLGQNGPIWHLVLECLLFLFYFVCFDLLFFLYTHTYIYFFLDSRQSVKAWIHTNT